MNIESKIIPVPLPVSAFATGRLGCTSGRDELTERIVSPLTSLRRIAAEQVRRRLESRRSPVGTPGEDETFTGTRRQLDPAALDPPIERRASPNVETGRIVDLRRKGVTGAVESDTAAAGLVGPTR